MVSELTQDLQSAGKYGEDVFEGHGTKVDVGEFVQLMNSYNVTAEPEKDRYIVQDDTHQYYVRLMNTKEASDGIEAFASVEECGTGFANKALEQGGVMNSEDEIEVDPGDGATYNDRSEALCGAADRLG